MCKPTSRAEGFDFGTSPHGLPASVSRAHQDCRCPYCLLSLADAFDIWGCNAQAAVLGAGRDAAVPRTAAASRRLPLHYLELSEEQCRHVAFALICQIEELEDSEEAAHPEVMEAIQHLNAACRILEGRPA